MTPQIDILLATFNGSSYLPQQLDSLLAQTCHACRLIVRDDGSTDGTTEILEYYRARFPDRFEVIPTEDQSLGASGNFGFLLERAEAPYVMLCDQDDIWLPHKVESTFNKIKEMESKYGKEIPLLVHTDLKVVDEKLNLLSESLWRYQLSDPRHGSTLNRLLLMNVATGCSVMVNRPLIDLALPIPPEAMMHDWWLVLVAAAFGHLGHIPEPTALYRQHGANDTGAKKWNFIDTFKSIANLKERKQQIELNRSVTQRIQGQSAAFLRRYEHQLSEQQRKMLEIYVNLDTFSFFMKRYYTVKYGFYYTGLIRNIGRFITI